MGDIADDMINGSSCSQCGMYFHDPQKPETLVEHGYPVVCYHCWNKMSKNERTNFQKAIYPVL